MDKHIHEDVLDTARRIAASRDNWTFTADEIVRALPHLNVNSVRTHVVSRCCVNAPKNHPHKWGYFRRVGRALYEVLPEYREPSKSSLFSGSAAAGGGKYGRPPLRDTVHVVVSKDGDTYIAECMELACVTQGHTLDDLVSNVREAIALHLEDEEPTALGLEAEPRMQLIYDMPRAV